MSPDKSRTIIIVGVVVGGAIAATRARRYNEDDRIIMYEKTPMCLSSTVAFLITSVANSMPETSCSWQRHSCSRRDSRWPCGHTGK